MPISPDLISETIRDELARLGIDASVCVDQLDSRSIMVTIISTAFENQTYLDREFRVRPAVLRALAANSASHLSAVIDVLEPASLPEGARQEATAGDNDDHRINRAMWKSTIESATRALVDSQYDLEPFEEGFLYVATRHGLTDERIVVGFTRSPRATTVDLDVREAMEVLRSARSYSGFYYIIPQELQRPFANQSVARWLTLTTFDEFLHMLNASARMAQALIDECTALLQKGDAKLHGPVIEPYLQVGSSETQFPAFEFLENWARDPATSFLLMMAPAGHGKTTIATEMTRRLARRFLEDPSYPVPLLLGFEAVRRTVDFEALLHKRLAQLRGGAFGAFRELLRINGAVLVVDGFDELAEDAGIGVAEAQVRSMRPFLTGRAHVILAGRSAFSERFNAGMGISERISSLLGNVPTETAEILPFSDGQVASYVETRSGLTSAQIAAARKFADTSADHMDVCSNPLLLSMVCTLAADERLPAHEVVATVDPLVEAVCLREETRQNLGMGVELQLLFLQEVALEAFREAVRTGSSTVGVEEVQLAAQLVTHDDSSIGTATIGRLADHALLTSTQTGRLTFVHPLIRDILIGRRLLGPSPQSTLCIGELPEGAVRYIAKRAAHHAEVKHSFFPQGWLSKSSTGRPETRRNLFRVALETARLRPSGDPRQWIEPDWIVNGEISRLDVSELLISEAAFQALRLVRCDLRDTIVFRCDFDDCTMSGCILDGTMIYDCSFEGAVSIEGNSVANVVVRTRRQQQLVVYDDEAGLQAALRNGIRPRPSKRRSVDVVMTVRSLLKAVLGIIVHIDSGVPKFHRIPLKVAESRLRQMDQKERAAVSSVVLPMTISHLCEQTLSGGSVRNIEIAKHWHGAVADFLIEDRTTVRLEEFLSRVATRASRYLTGRR